jgi:mannitol-1-phosphate 5-dehydrogenase
MDVECVEQKITNISGVNSTTDAVIAEIVEAEIITTAVGVVILPRIAPAIAKGIAARRAAGVEAALNIIACENAVRASSQLKEHVLALLEGEDKAYCEKWVGFPDCSVDRIVPPVRSENPIDVVVEAFYEWNVEQASFVGEVPQIAGMNLADNLLAYVERKLFTLNTGHAITAYMGCMKGLKTIDQSIADPQIYEIVKAAMQQSGLGLVAKHGLDQEAHFKYIDKIISRFKNPYLKDDVTRVGREPLRKLSAADRLINPTLTAQGAGVETPDLLLGIGAALHYNNAEDPQSVKMQERIAELGLKAAVAEFASLEADAPILDQIVAAYSEIEKRLA